MIGLITPEIPESILRGQVQLGFWALGFPSGIPCNPHFATRSMYQCYFCKGRVVKKIVTHVHTWEGKIFLFEDVPADVCQQCGEIYFSPDILETMDKIVASVASSPR